MAELQLLQGFFTTIIASPFLLVIAIMFFTVYIMRRILKVWKPKFENNRWYKTLLPLGIILISPGVGCLLSLIPTFGIGWAMGLITGLLGGGTLLLVYMAIENAIKQKIKEQESK
jgi:hypothetical protein